MNHHPDLADVSHPIPAWLSEAVNVDRSEGDLDVDGCRIHYFTWVARARPPLLFIHGRMSHARCWAFIAPLLANRFFCIAFDLSGMGDSGHRDAYSYAARANEAAARMQPVLPKSRTPVPVVGIVGAHHHIMVDQPIALAASIEAMVDALDTARSGQSRSGDRSYRAGSFRD